MWPDKNLSLRTIRVVEILRLTVGKVCVAVVKDDVTMAVGDLQLYGG